MGRLRLILGLLVVAACVVAYPLTWGRDVGPMYETTARLRFAMVHDGRLTVGSYGLPPGGGYRRGLRWASYPSESYVGAALVPMFRHYGFSGSWHLSIPLWLPAVAVPLGFAWRGHRRRRRQRDAAAFPVLGVVGSHHEGEDA